MAGAAANRAMDVAHRATVAFLMVASVWTGVEIFRGITHLRAHNIAYVRRRRAQGCRAQAAAAARAACALAAAALRAPHAPQLRPTQSPRAPPPPPVR